MNELKITDTTLGKSEGPWRSELKGEMRPIVEDGNSKPEEQRRNGFRTEGDFQEYVE